ncbi:MAG: hypothetical protein D6782_00915 [Alphaproteobacteria bacterium]|nr:MAG: hypothetical protein D6782_00915 [Alphaproteobacteria bacterium]
MRSGAMPPPAGAPRSVDRLNDLIAEDLLPDSRIALDNLLVKRIIRARRLADGLLLGELQALARIGTLCVANLPDKSEQRLKLEDALAGRCEKLLTPHAVAAYLADADTAYACLERLTALEPMVYGRANKRELANYILPILTAPEREKQLAVVDKQVIQRMQTLAKLQRLTARSGFDPAQKDKMLCRYDVLCHRMLRESQFLERFAATAGAPWEKALKLLHYLADVTFTEGKAAQAVRKLARDYMREGNFLESCVAHTDNPAEGARELKKLMDLMTAAGLSDQDSGAG